MANYSNSNNLQASQFLTFFITALRMHDIPTFDVTKFMDVVMHLKNTPEFETILNHFSTNFEQCQSQMIEMCGALKEGKYIEGETRYELHFLNQNFDSTILELPTSIDKNLLNQFFHFMKALQEQSAQDTILESQLLEVILRLQKGQNWTPEAIEKQRQGIYQYLSILSRFGFLTMSNTYYISISDDQFQNVLKSSQREEYKNMMNKVNVFLEYYIHPERLSNIPIYEEQIQSTIEKTPNTTFPNEVHVVEEVPQEVSINKDIYNGIGYSGKEKRNQNIPIMMQSFSENAMPNMIQNKEADNVIASSQPVTPNSHFKTVRGVLLSFFTTLQTQGIYHFDRESFEMAMNEIMKDPSIDYKFPSKFSEFAEKYIGVPLKGKERVSDHNPYTALNEWVRNKNKYIKREGVFCYQLQFPNDRIEYSLSHLTKEDMEKINALVELYRASYHKMSR